MPYGELKPVKVVWGISPAPLLRTNELTTPLCLAGVIPFETAGRKLDDDNSDCGGDRAAWADVNDRTGPAISPVEG